MSRVTVITFCVLSLWVCSSYAGGGMSCNVIGGTCPTFLSSDEDTFCCPSERGEYCCNASKFIELTGTKAILTIVLGVLSLVVIFICCLCCACCKCCPCYKKRERGIIYAQGPSTVVQVNQTPGNNQYTQPLYPAQPVMPQPPPSYTSEAYTKQSPYNPNYPNL
ncbi:protein shisa-4-like [Leptopilina boulardi]|uniref:protein shisa-4-like n=1 Tax=Leptopilina boulardi TaxID=63433 RepID=UPI0021F6932C|nr:protein shisa-4-like [Leptopilina boulardi]